MAKTPRQRPGDRAWLYYVMGGSATTLVYYAVPAEGDWLVVRIVLYCLISASAVPAIAVGLARYRPVPRLPWLIIGASQLVYAVADASFYTAHYIFEVTTFPFVADIFYIAHYPAVVAGLLLLIERRSPRRDVPNLLDASLLAVVAAMLSWLFLIEPRVRTDSPPLVTAASLAYPVLDLALFAVALRLMLGSGRRPTSFFLLAYNLLAFMAADSIYVLQQLGGTYGAGNFLDAIWLSGNIALGAAGLHPSMAVLGEPGPAKEQSLGPSRIAALTAAALVAPTMLLVQHGRGAFHDIPVIAAACAVLFLLTIARLVVMVVEQRRLAVTDVLTGLCTRRYFEAHLPQAMARCERAGRPLAVFIIDIDHFKSINDRYGHPVGDRVLVETATRLRRAVREGDVLARYGGEEFALLALDVDRAAVTGMAERLRAAVGGMPVELSTADRAWVTVSVGAAGGDGVGRSPQQLIADADRALYAAKAMGRDRVALGDELEHAPAVDRAAALQYLHAVAERVDRLLSNQPHGRPVGRWARLVCQRLGAAEATCADAELAGRLHDIGKIVLPESILAKPTALSEAEWALMRQHPDHGYRLIRAVAGMGEIAEIVREHHERLDGTGYPRGLAGTEIRFEARVIAVCDAWATMRSDRPYQSPLNTEEALRQLRDGSGGQFDPQVVDAFVELVEQGRIDELTTGSGRPLRA
ncbi:diguanylate cyclase (GGDEF)-like protein [Saccharopolyspora erythraea NRRL 2338]|uniref:Diguanylate cyclase (GGDEF domain) n=2 Tax=Saccharopolyspora erythraea TaxID=1836 RepID=A4FET9_SACEN|nr:diguanylate cyclase [Saccharopolyspora erythraea]EQD82032.1 diguanylate cyclase [Saccharopolyspora erythraea D]PFG96289.1 diguanylate cyclase (GGDEF)-like protein [Saccharopolyspora erythraea NRRL 2338]QRK92808.1 diguanylate cyclase [Saccharopolyspora erythraea]CAM02564.1 diguanylate cyclase (GGDEF domain) [Saccharopolyspora erythraea NRRL 2338]